MVTKTEQLPHDEGFIISEANGARSREQVTVAAGLVQVYAGTVMALRENGEYEKLDPNSSEDIFAAVGILCSSVDPSNGDGANGTAQKATLLVRDAEVRDDSLVWDTDMSAAQKVTATAELEALGIQVRNVATRVSTQSS